MKVFGQSRYLADLELPGALEAAFVRSPLPHASFLPVPLPDKVYDAAALGLGAITVDGPGLVATPWPPPAAGRVPSVRQGAAVAPHAHPHHAQVPPEHGFLGAQPPFLRPTPTSRPAV